MYKLNADARENFLFALEWLLAVTKRYPGPIQFGLAHIAYSNAKLLGETYGAKSAAQQLDEVLDSVHKTFRKTDLVMRDGAEFWLIVPFTAADEKISDKIKYILDSAKLAGLQIVERDISFFSLPLKGMAVKDDMPPAEFLDYLKKNHASLSNHEAVLPAST